MSNAQVKLPGMCDKHKFLLVRQAGYTEKDPWRALLIAAEVTLFQAMSCDKSVHAKIEGQIERISELGCFACYRPDIFGQVVREVCSSKKGDLSKVGKLGDRIILRAQASEGKVCPYCEEKDPPPESLGAVPDGINLNVQWRCPSCGKEWEGN